MNLTFSRRLAITIGIILPIAETSRRWGTGGALSWWLDDYLIAAFLLYAVWRSRNDAADGPRCLAAAWAFACGIGYMSFFGHLESIEQTDPAPIPHVWVTGIIGFGLGTCHRRVGGEPTSVCSKGILNPPTCSTGRAPTTSAT